jgi:hypothetical protein
MMSNNFYSIEDIFRVRKGPPQADVPKKALKTKARTHIDEDYIPESKQQKNMEDQLKESFEKGEVHINEGEDENSDDGGDEDVDLDLDLEPKMPVKIKASAENDQEYIPEHEIRKNKKKQQKNVEVGVREYSKKGIGKRNTIQQLVEREQESLKKKQDAANYKLRNKSFQWCPHCAHKSHGNLKKHLLQHSKLYLIPKTDILDKKRFNRSYEVYKNKFFANEQLISEQVFTQHVGPLDSAENKRGNFQVKTIQSLFK